MILSPEVLTILIVNGVFFLLASVAFFLSIKISLYWDINATTKRQYQLERESFLVSTIIKYIFIIKIPLFLFFIFTLDKISNLIVGAMCGVGVVNATEYGVYLLIIKILNIYIFGLWLTIYYLNIKHQHLPYTKIKFELFILSYILFIVELILMWSMFSSIDTEKMVSCCGTLFSSNSASTIGNIIRIKPSISLSAFYGTAILMLIFYKFRVKYLFAIINLFFLIVSLSTLISFFGTYIYQLPTHHCPFCFLQSDYNYIGYLIYTLLFLGSFYGIRSGIIEILNEDTTNSYRYSLLFNLLYLLVVTSYPIIYFIKNGVWL
jgi:hypothetical protein